MGDEADLPRIDVPPDLARDQRAQREFRRFVGTLTQGLESEPSSGVFIPARPDNQVFEEVEALLHSKRAAKIGICRFPPDDTNDSWYWRAQGPHQDILHFLPNRLVLGTPEFDEAGFEPLPTARSSSPVGGPAPPAGPPPATVLRARRGAAHPAPSPRAVRQLPPTPPSPPRSPSVSSGHRDVTIVSAKAARILEGTSSTGRGKGKGKGKGSAKGVGRVFNPQDSRDQREEREARAAIAACGYEVPPGGRWRQGKRGRGDSPPDDNPWVAAYEGTSVADLNRQLGNIYAARAGGCHEFDGDLPGIFAQLEEAERAEAVAAAQADRFARFERQAAGADADLDDLASRSGAAPARVAKARGEPTAVPHYIPNSAAQRKASGSSPSGSASTGAIHHVSTAEEHKEQEELEKASQREKVNLVQDQRLAARLAAQEASAQATGKSGRAQLVSEAEAKTQQRRSEKRFGERALLEDKAVSRAIAASTEEPTAPSASSSRGATVCKAVSEVVAAQKRALAARKQTVSDEQAAELAERRRKFEDSSGKSGFQRALFDGEEIVTVSKPLSTSAEPPSASSGPALGGPAGRVGPPPSAPSASGSSSSRAAGSAVLTPPVPPAPPAPPKSYAKAARGTPGSLAPARGVSTRPERAVVSPRTAAGVAPSPLRAVLQPGYARGGSLNDLSDFAKHCVVEAFPPVSRPPDMQPSTIIRLGKSNPLCVALDIHGVSDTFPTFDTEGSLVTTAWDQGNSACGKTQENAKGVSCMLVALIRSLFLHRGVIPWFLSFSGDPEQQARLHGAAAGAQSALTRQVSGSVADSIARYSGFGRARAEGSPTEVHEGLLRVFCTERTGQQDSKIVHLAQHSTFVLVDDNFDICQQCSRSGVLCYHVVDYTRKSRKSWSSKWGWHRHSISEILDGGLRINEKHLLSAADLDQSHPSVFAALSHLSYDIASGKLELKLQALRRVHKVTPVTLPAYRPDPPA